MGRIYKLGEICEIRSGKTPDTRKKEYWCSHRDKCDCISWFTGKDITEQITNPSKKITLLAAQKLQMPLTTENSIFYSQINLIRPLYLGQSGASCRMNVFILEPNELLIFPNWLYYFLLSKQNELMKKRIGTAQTYITQQHLIDLSINLPTLPNQHQILQKFQIVYNKLFQSEVVYNDFLLKILKKYLEIGDLLFAKYKDGKIRVGEKFKLVRGKAYNINYKVGTIKWVSSGDLTDCYFLTEKSKISKMITEEDLLNYKLLYINKNSLLAADREFNSQKIVWSQTNSCVIGGNVINLFNDNHAENATLLFSFRRINWSTYQTGSVIKQLPVKIIQNISFDWVSPPQIQTRFLTLLNSPLAKIKDLHTQIKDLLLLKYFGKK